MISIIKVLSIVLLVMAILFFGIKLSEEYHFQKDYQLLTKTMNDNQKDNSSQTQDILENKKLAESVTCKKYGGMSVDDYYNVYTVKTGDTLLSIAREQLGSTDKVGDLIVQNKDRFPSLSVDNPFLEVGWKLLILKPQYSSYHDKLYKGAGLVLKSTTDTLVVNWTKELAGQGYFYPGSGTQMIGKQSFQRGDCVIVTYAGSGRAVLSVELQ